MWKPSVTKYSLNGLVKSSNGLFPGAAAGALADLVWVMVASKDIGDLLRENGLPFRLKYFWEFLGRPHLWKVPQK
jgi:hypothetical protein